MALLPTARSASDADRGGGWRPGGAVKDVRAHIQGQADLPVRLTALSLRDVPPVRRFEIDDLSDVVVIAGPNGVGKTRLIQAILDQLRGSYPRAGTGGTIVATCDQERQEWEKDELNLASVEDTRRLLATFSAGRRRRNWRSSLINFESDRTIQNLQPYPFAFEMPDPSEEQVGWDLTFTPLKARFQDTVHAMYRMVESQRRSISTRAISLRREGKTEMRLEFTDPIQPFKDVFHRLLAPKELADLVLGDQRLQYLLEGNQLPFDSLSSGEREVVNIAFDFLLRSPRDCIVFFDEPELHLHPELSYKLVQVLQGIGENNQFIFTTHSPDIITSALDRSVVFLAPANTDVPVEGAEPMNQAIAVAESDETHQALKLLGQSIGIVALGRRIVLVEGASSSLDKQTYGSILQQRYPGLVLVPSGGKHAIESFQLVHEAVLSKSLWGVDFFMVCDGDSRPTGTAAVGGRLALLPRYHVENYFLDEHIWAVAFAELVTEASWLRNAAQIREKLRELAREQVPYAVALKIGADLRQQAGNVSVSAKQCHNMEVEQLVAALESQLSAEQERLEGVLDLASVSSRVEHEFAAIMTSLDSDTDVWKTLIPGKPLISRFANSVGVKPGHAKSLYVNRATLADHDPFADIVAIFDGFASI